MIISTKESLLFSFLFFGDKTGSLLTGMVIGPVMHLLCAYPLGYAVFLFMYLFLPGARRSSMIRAFAHGAMGRRIDPSWWTH